MAGGRLGAAMMALLLFALPAAAATLRWSNDQDVPRSTPMRGRRSFSDLSMPISTSRWCGAVATCSFSPRWR